MSIPPTWGDLGDKRAFSRNGIQAIAFWSEISRVSWGKRGGRDEGAGTKQNFSVQNRSSPQSGYSRKEEEGKAEETNSQRCTELEVLLLQTDTVSALTCDLCSFLCQSNSHPKVLVWGPVSCVPFYGRLWREEPRMWKMAQAGGDH